MLTGRESASTQNPGKLDFGPCILYRLGQVGAMTRPLFAMEAGGSAIWSIDSPPSRTIKKVLLVVRLIQFHMRIYCRIRSSSGGQENIFRQPDRVAGISARTPLGHLLSQNRRPSRPARPKGIIVRRESRLVSDKRVFKLPPLIALGLLAALPNILRPNVVRPQY